MEKIQLLYNKHLINEKNGSIIRRCTIFILLPLLIIACVLLVLQIKSAFLFMGLILGISMFCIVKVNYENTLTCENTFTELNNHITSYVKDILDADDSTLIYVKESHLKPTQILIYCKPEMYDAYASKIFPHIKDFRSIFGEKFKIHFCLTPEI